MSRRCKRSPKGNFSLPDLGAANQAVTNLLSLETHQLGAREGFRCAPSILRLKASVARACGSATRSSQGVKLTRPSKPASANGPFGESQFCAVCAMSHTSLDL